MGKMSIHLYLNLLTREHLGSHYKYYKQEKNEFSWVYCEHYKGLGFANINSCNPRSWMLAPREYPGAVARIHNNSSMVVPLDHSRSYHDEFLYAGALCEADTERIYPSQPDFLERFKTIKIVHDKVCRLRQIGKPKSVRTHLCPKVARTTKA